MADVAAAITASVTGVNTEVVGLAPGYSMAQLYQASASAMGILIENSSNAQAAAANLMLASNAVGVAVLNKLAADVAK